MSPFLNMDIYPCFEIYVVVWFSKCIAFGMWQRQLEINYSQEPPPVSREALEEHVLCPGATRSKRVYQSSAPELRA